MEPRVAATAPVIATRAAVPVRRSGFAQRHVATAFLAVVFLADVGAIVLARAKFLAVNGAAPSPAVLAILVLTASFGVVGWIVASRRPDNRIGWVFLTIGLSLSIEVFATAYSGLVSVASPGSVPFADLMSWVATWAWAPGYTCLVTLSVLLFPDGLPPTPRWRPVVWSSFAVLALLLVPVAIASGLAALGVVGSDGRIMNLAFAMQTVGLVASAFVAMASIAGMVVRFRRAGRTERQQLRWFSFAAVVVIALVVTIEFVTPPDIVGLVASVLIAPLLPAAAAIAILRYRLYDLDRLVSRTIAYATVTGVLVVVFGVAAIALQSALAPITGKNGVAVAVSTLLVVALFQPLRRRIQTRVDRRFNRHRYDAERTASAFAGRLREEVDLGRVVVDLGATVSAAMAPNSVMVWLRRKD